MNRPAEKKKYCEVGEHMVFGLWKAKKKDQKSCCKSCLHKVPVKAKAESLVVKQNLNIFFATQALVFPYVCENCNIPLNARSAFDRRKMTAHILPKTASGGFPSVGDHLENKMFLCCMGGNYCHEKWDGGDAGDRIKMPVYDLAIKRFQSFKSLLNAKELIKANKYLNLENE